MGRISASICIDREKVYGFLNRECITMSDVSKDVGVHPNTISYWLKCGKVTQDNIDIFALAIGADPSEIKGKSSDEIGPEQRKYIDQNYTCTSELYWTRIDGPCFHALIIKNYKTLTQFAKHVGMSEPMISNYVRWKKIPRQYERRFGLALNVEPSEFVVDEPSEFVVDEPIDILEERDGKVEKVKNLVEAVQNYADVAEEASVAFANICPVDSSEVDALHARIQELEKRLAKYEKSPHREKASFRLQSRLHDSMGATLEKEGIDNGFAVASVENAIFTLADISMGNYKYEFERVGNRSGFRRNHDIEVDEEKYSAYVHELYKGFIEQFNAR